MPRHLLYLILLSFCPIATLGQCNKGWGFIDPFPTGDMIKEFHVVSPDTIYGIHETKFLNVTTGGAVIKSVDGGSSWTIFKDIGNEILSDIFFIDRKKGWVIGENGAAHRTFDGGKNWTDVSVPTNKKLNAVEFATEDTGFVAGKNGALFRTIDGGDTWSSVPSGTSDDLFDIDLLDRDTGYVVGGSFGSSVVLYTDDGGMGWVQRNVGTSEDLLSVDFYSRDTGYVVGTDTTVRYTYDGGISWGQKSFGGLSTTDIHTVQFTDPDTGYIGATIGEVLRTVDGGDNWGTVWNGGTYVEAFHFVDGQHGWMRGYNTELYSTSSAGNNWSRRDTTFSLWDDQETYTDMDVVETDTVYVIGGSSAGAGGEKGTVYRSTNGGEDWQHIYTTNSISSGGLRIRAVDFIDGTTGWVAGREGFILHTCDGGSSWNDQSPGSSGDIQDIHFIDGDTGMAVAENGKIFQTDDGGAFWAVQTGVTSKSLNAVHLIDGAEAIAVGNDGTILRTTNGGVSWTSISTSISKDLEGLHFNGDDTVWAVGGQGTVLFSSDAGMNWTEQTTTISQKLNSVDFLGSDTGWCSGYLGTVLKTTDGGDNWERSLTGTDQALYAIDMASQGQVLAVGSEASVFGFFGKPFYADASFDYSKTSGLTVDLSALQPNQEVYDWDLGDGNTSNIQDPVHTYPDSGTYEVCLTVTDSCGRMDSVCTSIDICYPLDAGFTDSIDGTTVHFQDTSVGGTFWSWEFGDQGYGNQKNPTHDFGNTGIYEVCMVVGNKCNEKDTVCKSIDLTNTGLQKRKRELLTKVSPNPFTDRTKLFYQLSEAQRVWVRIMDDKGRTVQEIGPLQKEQGSHSMELDLQGKETGIYYYTMKTESSSMSGKLIHMQE